jgi:PhnB protein
MARSKAKTRSQAKSAKKAVKASGKKAAPKRARAKLAPHAKGRLGVPEGFTTLTAHLVVEGAADAMDFYKRAFGAEEIGRAPMPDGKKLMHGLMKVGDAMLMLVDAFPEFGAKGPKELGGSPVTLHVYVKDADEAFQRAVDAGCTVAMPMADMFWGDRYGKVKDPFGHEWSIATKIKNLSPEEMEEAQKAAFAAERPNP